MNRSIGNYHAIACFAIHYKVVYSSNTSYVLYISCKGKNFFVIIATCNHYILQIFYQTASKGTGVLSNPLAEVEVTYCPEDVSTTLADKHPKG